MTPSTGRRTGPGRFHRAVYTEPKDASLDLESMQITDHAVGVDFDVQQLKTAYQNAKSGETVIVPLTLTQPKVTRATWAASCSRTCWGRAPPRCPARPTASTT